MAPSGPAHWALCCVERLHRDVLWSNPKLLLRGGLSHFFFFWRLYLMSLIDSSRFDSAVVHFLKSSVFTTSRSWLCRSFCCSAALGSLRHAAVQVGAWRNVQLQDLTMLFADGKSFGRQKKSTATLTIVLTLALLVMAHPHRSVFLSFFALITTDKTDEIWQ